MERQSESIDIASIKRAIMRSLFPLPQPISEDAANPISNSGQLAAIENAFQKAVALTPEEGRNTAAAQTNTQHRGQKVSQGFSHLASTVPDSQGLQPLIDVSSSFQPLASSTKPLPSSKIFRKKMTSQSSPHDTQELSPSYYEDLINLYKSKSAQGLREEIIEEDEEEAHSQGVDDSITQRTTHTGDPGHIDLGLSDSGHEDGEAQASDVELNSEPIDFSPTQATQSRLSQFPESQRFKTPATNGKKRNYLGEVIDSPVLPRNPLASHGVTRTPVHALGLSQVFAGTQAGSSPVVTRHLSEPKSDRPSPNIEMQARPATASLSSPLRPQSEVKRLDTEPQSRYISLKQSQAERDRREALRQQSSDGIAGDEESDDDFDDEPSIVKRTRRLKEREQGIRERFARFTSPTRPSSAAKASGQASAAARAQTSSPVRRHSRRIVPPTVAENNSAHIQEHAEHDCEDETDVGEEEVIIRHSSQRGVGDEGEDKENMYAGALQVPETVSRLHQFVNGQEGRDESPTLQRSFAQPPVEALRSSQTIRQGPMNGAGFTGSPTVAVANSQPDQLLSKELASNVVKPPKGPGAPYVSSSAVGATEVESSPHRDEDKYRHDLARDGGDEATAAQQQKNVNMGNRDGLSDGGSNSSSPEDQGRIIPNTEFDQKRPAEHLSTAPGTAAAVSAVKNDAQLSSGSISAANGTSTEQLPSRFETAQSHVSSNTPVQRPLNSLFSSPSGRKSKRLGDIAAQPSPKKLTGETEVNEVMAAMDDSEFYDAIGDAPASSSPIPPGRNAKRQRLVDRLTVSSRATSATTTPNLPSIPPTDDLLVSGHVTHQTPAVPSSKARPGRRRRSEGLWEVQLSPPKPVPAKTMRNTVKGVKAPSRKTAKARISKPLKQKGSTAPETLQDDAAQEPSETSASKQTPHAASTKVIAPNQVLARFNGNPRGYYPATCLGSTGLKSDGTFRYQIQWDDSTRDDVDGSGIRRLDLRVGDQVKVNLEGWPRVSHVVQGFKDHVENIGDDVTDIRGFRTLLLKPKKRKSLPAHLSTENVEEAPLSAIYLDTNMWGQMKDRTYDLDLTYQRTRLTLDVPQQPAAAAAAAAAASRSGLTTPSERPSTPSTPSSRTRRKSDFPAQSTSATFPFPAPPSASGIFSNMAFSISYTNDDRKTSLTNAITSNGGTVLREDFHEIFDEDSSPSLASTVRRDQFLTLNPQFSGIGFVALIADRHSRKIKYMQALALNLPCLSGRWVEACLSTKDLVEWRPYLLAAGESAELEGAVRSRVLPPMDARTTLLREIVETRPRLLQGEAVVVVKGRGKAEEKRRPYVFLAKAMGAGKVDTCVDLKAAKALLDEDEEGALRWVFVDDREVGRAEEMLLPKARGNRKEKERGGLRVVGNEFVCQSLILGRLWDA